MILMTVHFPPLKLKTQPTHVITHGVLLKVNPDRPNIHRMSAESRPELRDLRRIALARIPGSIAREPVRVDVRDPRRPRVVVRRHEVRVDLAPDAARFLEPADDRLGEALAVGSIVMQCELFELRWAKISSSHESCPKALVVV